MLICRQVDDLAIGCANADAIRDLVRVICTEDGIDLRDEGILESFNGVNVEQTDSYIKITCETYIDKLLATMAGRPQVRVRQTRSRSNHSPHPQHNRCSRITLLHPALKLANIVTLKRLLGFLIAVSWTH
jgi:hypothetical protein